MLEAPLQDADVEQSSLGHVRQCRLAKMHAWRLALRRRFCPTPVVVLIADPAQRVSLEFEVRRGLHRLERVLGFAIFAPMTVIVQHSIHLEHAVAGCTHVGQHADGSPFALVRVALSVDGHDLSIDEALAVLAEQCIGLAVQQAGGMGVVVPVKWTSAVSAAVSAPPAVRDPLAPSRNGHVPVPTRPGP